jgi:hypothetical protein
MRLANSGYTGWGFDNALRDSCATDVSDDKLIAIANIKDAHHDIVLWFMLFNPFSLRKATNLSLLISSIRVPQFHTRRCAMKYRPSVQGEADML